MLVVYDDLNHTTGQFESALAGFEYGRHGEAEQSACQSLSSSSPFMKKGVDVALKWPQVLLWLRGGRVYLHINLQFTTTLNHRLHAT